MKKKNGVFLGLLIAALLLLTMACPTANNPTPTAVTFESAVQTGGTDGTDNSTGLTLTFSVDPTTLTADDITLSGATKGALTGEGTTRTLAISNITVGNGETVSVAIANPSGFTISGSPQTAVVYKDTRTAITFESAVQTGGSSGTASTTGLTLTFSVDPTTLTADDITLSGATKGALTGTGTTRTLAISDITVANGETVSVAIAHPTGFTISGSPKTAVVYKVYNLRDAGPAGGLIFYDKGSYSDGWRYLEVAPASTEGTSNVWGGYGTTVTGADGTAIGTGAQNTIDIVTQFGGQEPYASKTDYAAKLCSDLESGGYDDWFLPSKDELDAIWDNLVDDGTGSNNGVGGFANVYYWSSSENGSSGAWYQYFFTGFQSSATKDGNLRVRAVRAF